MILRAKHIYPSDIQVSCRAEEESLIGQVKHNLALDMAKKIVNSKLIEFRIEKNSMTGEATMSVEIEVQRVKKESEKKSHSFSATNDYLYPFLADDGTTILIDRKRSQSNPAGEMYIVPYGYELYLKAGGIQGARLKTSKLEGFIKDEQISKERFDVLTNYQGLSKVEQIYYDLKKFTPRDEIPTNDNF